MPTQIGKEIAERIETFSDNLTDAKEHAVKNVQAALLPHTIPLLELLGKKKSAENTHNYLLHLVMENPDVDSNKIYETLTSFVYKLEMDIEGVLRNSELREAAWLGTQRITELRANLHEIPAEMVITAVAEKLLANPRLKGSDSLIWADLLEKVHNGFTEAGEYPSEVVIDVSPNLDLVLRFHGYKGVMMTSRLRPKDSTGEFKARYREGVEARQSKERVQAATTFLDEENLYRWYETHDAEAIKPFLIASVDHELARKDYGFLFLRSKEEILQVIDALRTGNYTIEDKLRSDNSEDGESPNIHKDFHLSLSHFPFRIFFEAVRENRWQIRIETNPDHQELRRTIRNKYVFEKALGFLAEEFVNARLGRSFDFNEYYIKERMLERSNSLHIDPQVFEKRVKDIFEKIRPQEVIEWKREKENDVLHKRDEIDYHKDGDAYVWHAQTYVDASGKPTVTEKVWAIRPPGENPGTRLK